MAARFSRSRTRCREIAAMHPKKRPVVQGHNRPLKASRNVRVFPCSVTALRSTGQSFAATSG